MTGGSTDQQITIEVEEAGQGAEGSGETCVGCTVTLLTSTGGYYVDGDSIIDVSAYICVNPTDNLCTDEAAISSLFDANNTTMAGLFDAATRISTPIVNAIAAYKYTDCFANYNESWRHRNYTQIAGFDLSGVSKTDIVGGYIYLAGVSAEIATSYGQFGPCYTTVLTCKCQPPWDYTPSWYSSYRLSNVKFLFSEDANEWVTGADVTANYGEYVETVNLGLLNSFYEDNYAGANCDHALDDLVTVSTPHMYFPMSAGLVAWIQGTTGNTIYVTADMDGVLTSWSVSKHLGFGTYYGGSGDRYSMHANFYLNIKP